jgi:hypothetical protein
MCAPSRWSHSCTDANRPNVAASSLPAVVPLEHAHICFYAKPHLGWIGCERGSPISADTLSKTTIAGLSLSVCLHQLGTKLLKGFRYNERRF